MSLHRDVMHIIHHAIDAVLPEHAVKEQLRKKPCEGRVILVSIGKAAWRMARAAVDVLGDQVAKGVVITKYEHSQGPIKNFLYGKLVILCQMKTLSRPLLKPLK